MANPFKRRGDEGAPHNNSNQVVLTAAMFFGKTGAFKYFDTEEFLNYGDKLRDTDADDLDALFGLTTEGAKLAFSRQVRTDRGGSPYSYQNFQRPKGPEGVKIVLGGNLLQFVKDYHAGKFITDFTLADLVAEAEKGL